MSGDPYLRASLQELVQLLRGTLQVQGSLSGLVDVRNWRDLAGVRITNWPAALSPAPGVAGSSSAGASGGTDASAAAAVRLVESDVPYYPADVRGWTDRGYGGGREAGLGGRRGLWD